MSRDAEWETCVPVAECSWKQIAEPVMNLYTETTDGSTIENKETALVWSYEDADPDFGSCQAKELLDHLESVLANEPVTVKSGQNTVEVKPQVCVAFLSSCALFIYCKHWYKNLFGSYCLCCLHTNMEGFAAIQKRALLYRGANALLIEYQVKALLLFYKSNTTTKE